MRFIYIDESGIDRRDRKTIVAGVLVRPDAHWRAVASRLEQLREEFIPTHLHERFVFHATDTYSGRGVVGALSVARRKALMEAVLAIPMEFDLQVAFGFADRRDEDDPAISHLMSFACCLKAANDLIRVNMSPEIGVAVVEDNAAMRRHLKGMSNFLRKEELPDILAKHPFDAIPDQIHFASKREAVMLQIADHCAFALKRCALRQKDGDALFQALDPAVTDQSIFNLREAPFGIGYVLKDISRWQW
jgi:hypothetical protein